MDYIFTSESVADGHPDKVCDQVSDAIVDFYLSQDPNARVAVETVATTNYVGLFGEITSIIPNLQAHHEKIVRQVIQDIGYEQDNFHWKTLECKDHTHPQSPDIALGVDQEGAGDQGIMFGFATDETPSLIPAPLFYSHKILEQIYQARHAGQLPDLGPDAKSQVSLYYQDNKPVRVTRLVLSTQHHEKINQDDVRQLVMPYLEKTLPDGWMCVPENIFINPTGRFVLGGPAADVGLTGRKIIVDTYGGAAPHGGGAFSGKDPTKVDRSAAYMMRYLAKNVVASGLAKKCTLQISYAIGIKEPLSFYVNTHGTSKIPNDIWVAVLKKCVDLTPRGIIEHLKMKNPLYRRTASYGHFGRIPEQDGGFSWEKLDLVEILHNNL